jgi:hypothetical protein
MRFPPIGFRLIYGKRLRCEQSIAGKRANLSERSANHPKSFFVAYFIRNLLSTDERELPIWSEILRTVEVQEVPGSA